MVRCCRSPKRRSIQGLRYARARQLAAVGEKEIMSITGL
jgi:hypothetical protein